MVFLLLTILLLKEKNSQHCVFMTAEFPSIKLTVAAFILMIEMSSLKTFITVEVLAFSDSVSKSLFLCSVSSGN